ncbi:hypothetical protein ACWELJ_07115 [Nocardia sp. NPDC004582]
MAQGESDGMGPIAQQLLTISGVLLGAGAAFTATTLIERSKWRRTLDTRWDDKRLAAYSEFAGSLKSLHEVLYRLAATAGLPAIAQPLDREVGLAAMAAAEGERTVRWEAVLLLGSTDVISAGRQWHKEILDLSHVVLAADPDHTEYLRLFQSTGRLRNSFYDFARADLGVRGGVLPPGDVVWLPPGYTPGRVDAGRDGGSMSSDQVSQPADSD